jgi:hypothetical protein
MALRFRRGNQHAAHPALRHPATIKQRNKPRLMLLNIDDYERLMRQSDDRSVGTPDYPGELLDEFEAAVDETRRRAAMVVIFF